jgi:hypothetical protein
VWEGLDSIAQHAWGAGEALNSGTTTCRPSTGVRSATDSNTDTRDIIPIHTGCCVALSAGKHAARERQHMWREPMYEIQCVVETTGCTGVSTRFNRSFRSRHARVPRVSSAAAAFSRGVGVVS